MNAWFFVFYGDLSNEKAMPNGIAFPKEKEK